MRLGTLFVSLAAAGVIAVAAFGFDTASRADPGLDRPAVEAIVHDYLVKNPEVLEEAMAALQTRREAQQQAQARTAVEKNRAAILNAPQNEVIGNPKGDVTLVEFFDYNCGYCKHTLGDVLKLSADDPNLRIVLKDFPVLGPGSVEAASVAVAVKQQLQGDRFMRFHRELLATRGPVAKDRALEVAKLSGVDMIRLATDMDEAKVQPQLRTTLALGDQLGISGTPSFVIGDELVVGAVGYDALKGRIESMRRCGKTTCG